MSNGFYGFTVDGVTKLISVNGDAEPHLLGKKVLAYADEAAAGVTKASVLRMRMVDEDEEIGEYVDYLSASLAARPGETWGQVFARADSGSVSTPLALGFAIDAELYGDASWGYVLNFDDNAFEVFKSSIAAPAKYSGRVLCDSCYLVVSYYLNHLPSAQLFLEGVAEGVNA